MTKTIEILIKSRYVPTSSFDRNSAVNKVTDILSYSMNLTYIYLYNRTHIL